MNYRALKEKENRAKLFGVIRNKTMDFLGDEDIHSILERVDVNKKYSIVVVDNPDEFAKYLQPVKYSGFEHSWAGEKYERAEVTVLFGEEHVYDLGYHYDYQYYNNGNLANEEYEDILPDFNIEQNIVIYRYEVDYSNYNGEYYNTESNYLVFYRGVKAGE